MSRGQYPSRIKRISTISWAPVIFQFSLKNTYWFEIMAQPHLCFRPTWISMDIFLGGIMHENEQKVKICA